MLEYSMAILAAVGPLLFGVTGCRFLAREDARREGILGAQGPALWGADTADEVWIR